MLEDCVDICVVEGERKGFFPKVASCAGGGKIDRKKVNIQKHSSFLYILQFSNICPRWTLWYDKHAWNMLNKKG